MNLTQGSNFRSIVLFVLLFFSVNMFFAQVDRGTAATVDITLKDGAKIYSADDSFNKQVLAGIVVVKNTEISHHETAEKKNFLKLVAKRSPKVSETELQHQLKLAENIKEKEALEKVKKEIDKFEESVNAFSKLDFKDNPASNEFFSSKKQTKNYVLPSYNHHPLSKINEIANAYINKRALDFLHSQKYTYYNNKSLDFCFSEVFSVRPPPFLG